MPSSGMWRRVGLLQTDVSEERVASTLFTLTKKMSTVCILCSYLKAHYKHSEPVQRSMYSDRLWPG
jgi:hypothetical protein